MIEPIVPRALRLTRGLVNFLVEMTEAAERNPELDILQTNPHQPWRILWLEDLPAGVEKVNLNSDDVLFSMRPPALKPEPAPPEVVRPWLDASHGWDIHTHEPRLHEPGSVALQSRLGSHDIDDAARSAEGSRPPQSVHQEFGLWLTLWRVWAVERRQSELTAQVYAFLEGAAKEVEQRDDESELILARGLVRWIAPDGRTLR